RSGPKVKLDLPSDIEMDAHADWLVVKRRASWLIAGHDYPADTLLGISLAAFLAGQREFAVLFEPGERRALQGFLWTKGKLVLSILDELRPVFEVLTPSGTGWALEKLKGLPDIGVAHVWRVDSEEAESNGDLFANVQDPITPAALMLIEPAKSPEVLK